MQKVNGWKDAPKEAVGMKSILIAVSAIIILTFSPAATAHAGDQQTYTHPTCGFSFQYPSSWQVVPNSKYIKDRCAVTLRPHNFKEFMEKFDVDVYTLVVSMKFGGFLRAADRAGFDFHDGELVMACCVGMTDEAKVIKTEKWSGVRGIATMRCHHEKGGYAGLCEFERLVVRDANDRILTMDGGPQTDAAFEPVFSTFSFKDEQ